METEITTIDLIVPKGWNDLSDKQLEYLYKLIAEDFDLTDIRLLCLLRWSKTKVIGRSKDGNHLLLNGKTYFEVSAFNLASLIMQELSWIGPIPSVPVRISKIKRHRALPADFAEVPFEKFIMVDNLYQGYLMTHDSELLEQIASVTYGHDIKLKPCQRISVFYWIASLKEFFSHKFPDFFQPVSNEGADGNLLGSQSATVEEAMNAQIRALTKGDITKEKEILSMDTWRALTELNAQAREYKELNAKMKSK